MSDWVTLKDAIGLTLRPINDWPGKQTSSRDKGPFSAPLKDTLRILKRELSALHAQKVILQIAIREQDLRLDGLPRSGAVAMHPGVILAFESKHGPLRLWFDRFSHWTNNLRAIAMHLEHLRLSALYGVGEDGQQYKGWQALPPPTAPSTREDAVEWLRHASGLDGDYSDPEIINAAFRKVSLKVHPDHGGDATEFIFLQNTRAMLMASR